MNPWEFITMFGEFRFWIAACFTALVIYFSVPKRLRRYVAWFIFLTLPSVIVSYSITGILKVIFKVPRPCYGLEDCPTTYSFPSGHAAVAFAALTTIALRYKNEKFGFILLILACLIAYSRIVLNVHRFEDVIVGSVIGIVSASIIWKVSKNINYSTHRAS